MIGWIPIPILILIPIEFPSHLPTLGVAMNPEAATRPLVGILMGSDSDWPTMKAAADVCGEFQVDCEVRVISAHRTPKDLEAYASGAVDRGLRVIIAGAGGAAHLPGVTAAFTVLPVIGVDHVLNVFGKLPN